MSKTRAAAPLLAILLLLACRTTGESSERRYREPEGRFEILHPAGWFLSTTEQDGVAFWRWTPEALDDPAAKAESDLTVALVPLPDLPEARLTDGSLEEVAEYVRDIMVMTAAGSGFEFRAGPARRDRVGKRDAIRFDLRGRDEAGTAERVTLLTMRAKGGTMAIVLSFGGDERRARERLALLERCARSFRLPASR